LTPEPTTTSSSSTRPQTFTPTLYGATTGSPGNSHDIVDYDPAIDRGSDIAKVFDVKLIAGQYYVIKSIYDYNMVDDANVFLLSSDPANSNTWIRTRSTALRVMTGSTVGVYSGGCTRIRAARTDWYGLVILFDDRDGGLHSYEAYDIETATASQGTSCKQAGTF
jgi:hypothetical protein